VYVVKFRVMEFSLTSWIFLVFLGGARLSLLGTSTTIWPIIQPLDDDEREAVGEWLAGEAEGLGDNTPVPLRP
jgi:hypothetical protein